MEPWERAISCDVAQKVRETFGEDRVDIKKNDPRHKLVDEYCTKKLKDCPTDQYGSHFINTYCIIVPQLVVIYSKLDPLCESQVEGSIFSDEVGKKFEIDPLEHPIFGKFTQKSTLLKLKNIRINNPLRANEHTKESLKKECVEPGTIVINAHTKTGWFNVNQRLKKTDATVDIEFGDILSKKDCIVAVETTGRPDSMKLIIPLPSYKVKITPTGTITLPPENGKILTADQLFGKGPMDLINREETFNVPFTI